MEKRYQIAKLIKDRHWAPDGYDMKCIVRLERFEYEEYGNSCGTLEEAEEQLKEIVADSYDEYTILTIYS